MDALAMDKNPGTLAFCCMFFTPSSCTERASKWMFICPGPRFLYLQILKIHYSWQNAYASLLNPRCLTAGTFFDAPTTGLAKLSFCWLVNNHFGWGKHNSFPWRCLFTWHNSQSQQEFTNNHSDWSTTNKSQLITILDVHSES